MGYDGVGMRVDVGQGCSKQQEQDDMIFHKIYLSCRIHNIHLFLWKLFKKEVLF